MVIIRINTDKIINQINRCYLDWDPGWPREAGLHVAQFKQHMKENAGLILDFEQFIMNGHFGFKLTGGEIVDEPKYVMWLLRWS